ncbi:metallophosphoesterase [Intestinimonas massiliensis (ex Afouda et al. 2020)]|uniref:metallophosphoesterase n=1 Tax=Intestinimonas massiliensis (ex Afouda et al. 2020) TaxID=1673721 RepID=UPI0010319DCD|nr:metallophosphoesterase [Intestinimonas massiliensis (ex Afouda et al. 2020)]
MKKRTRHLLAAGGIAAGLLVWAGLDSGLTVREYTVESEKIDSTVRLVLLTDLHCCDYGEGQQKLLHVVEAQNPDLVLLSGDMVDDDPRLPEEKALTAVEALAERWPVYYVTGNHEFWSGRVEEIKEALRQRGAVVLEGESRLVTAAGQTIQICGVDDPNVGERAWRSQMETVTAALKQDVFSVLLTHRPERVTDYTGRGFDLVLAGHAHGGQWRLPGLINGLIAPNQGLFPRYAGGTYDLEGTTLIVSRGLARESTRVPRFFNPPEVVVIEVTSEAKK